MGERVSKITFPNGFAATMDNVLDLEKRGFTRKQIAPTLGLTVDHISRAMRIYLTSLGRTADAAKIEVRNKAIELVKKLEAEEIRLSSANREFVDAIRASGAMPISRTAASINDPTKQLLGYHSAIAALEGMCFGLDKMPEVVHSSITLEQRKEIETRLAECRRIIERRINIIRRDTNVEHRP